MWTTGRDAPRQICAEDAIDRLTRCKLAALLALAMFTFGCSGKGPRQVSEEPPKSEPPEESKRLYTGKGQATVRETSGERFLLYVIEWEKTQLDYTLEQGASAGRLEKVSGTLYQEGSEASKFSADAAIADKAKGLLVLEGNVSIEGLTDPKGNLKCQKLEWKTNQKLLKAVGDVTLKSTNGTIGPVPELWCLPDLKRAGTPGFFQS